MTVQLDPCPVCGWADWPEGGMHAAREIHIRTHERAGETADTGWIQALSKRDTGKYPAAGRGANPVGWPDVGLLFVLVAGLVGLAWVCVWGVTRL